MHNSTWQNTIGCCRWNPKHAQWVKDRMKLLAMVTNQHFAMSDSHALLTQHVVERCSSHVYRRVGERYADTCVIQRQSFGGSVMVCGCITAHGRTSSKVK
jgi:hypothetical protein